LSATAEKDPAASWTMSGPLKSAAEADYQREHLDFRIAAYLRGAGWNHTSDTPGCFCMWERKIKGRRLLVSQDTALRMQQDLEAL
jgi:hypothetical protein